jgi:lysophospholipase L1-like esterase
MKKKTMGRLLLLVSTLTLLEAGARVFFSRNWHGFEQTRKFLSGDALPDPVSQVCIPQPYLLYIPAPKYVNAQGPQHNGQGYRGRPVTIERTPGVTRILCMGGSTTYGWGVALPDEAYPALLEKELNELNENRPEGATRVEVINAGVPSGTSAELLTHYQFKFHYYRPDLVIVHTGINDAIAMHAKYYHPDYSNCRRQVQLPEPLPPFGRCLLRSRLFSLFLIPVIKGPYPSAAFYSADGQPPYAIWFDKGQASDGTTSIANIPPEHLAFRHNLNMLFDQFDRDNARILVFPERMNPNWHEPYGPEFAYAENVLQEVAEARGITYAPLPADVVTLGNWFDECHTNTEGNLEIARYISSYATRVLLSDP